MDTLSLSVSVVIYIFFADVIVRVVKKTFAGIAGLLHLRQHKPCQNGGDREYRRTLVCSN